MPRQARVSREDVLDATLAIAEQRGLGAVTMRAVAARLGVTPMALYRHVDGKHGLLDALVERLLLELPVPDPALPWDERLSILAASLREAAARHPDAFGMLLRRPATTPGALRAREAVYRALGDAGVLEALIPRVERLLSTFMIGFAASEAGGRFSAHDTAILDEDLRWAQSLILGAASPATRTVSPQGAPAPRTRASARAGGRAARASRARSR